MSCSLFLVGLQYKIIPINEWTGFSICTRGLNLNLNLPTFPQLFAMSFMILQIIYKLNAKPFAVRALL